METLTLSLLAATLLSMASHRSLYSMDCTMTIYVSPDYVAAAPSSETGHPNAFWDGHAFVAIRNNSPITVTAGSMTLYPFSSITIGKWDSFNGQHSGLWYNLESERGSLTHNVALSVTFSMSSLLAVNTYIANQDNQWELTDNCVHFACGAWNIVSSDTLQTIALMTPSMLYSNISAISGHSSNVSIPSDSRKGYYSGSTFVDWNGNWE